MSTASERPRILIVEDEPVVAADLQSSLEALGYQVVGAAATAAEAMHATVEKSPELILMDITLQGSRDGIAAAEEIRSRWGTPIVFLTGNSDEEKLLQANATGASGYLLKPFRIRELNAAILVALQQHRSARELFSERTWLQTLIESLNEGVIATDPMGRVRHMNPAAEALTGCSFAEADGKHIEDVSQLTMMSNEPVELCKLRHALRSKSPTGKGRFLLHSRDGRVIPIEDSAAPIQAGGQIIGAVNVFVDISELVREEQEQELERERLAQEVQVTAEALGNTRADLRALSAHLLSIQEDERRRIARELHDDVVQRMAAAEIDLQRLIPIVTPRNGTTQELLEKTRERIAGVTATLREVSHRLHPAVVDDLGIVAALRSLVNDYSDRGMEASFAAPEAHLILKREVGTALYRIAQEALRNVSKHAHGAPVRVAIEKTPTELHLKIEDAGPGFDLRNIREKGGLGLLSMQERARLAGGNLLLRSRPGNGTLVLARIPLESAEQNGGS